MTSDSDSISRTAAVVRTYVRFAPLVRIQADAIEWRNESVSFSFFQNAISSGSLCCGFVKFPLARGPLCLASGDEMGDHYSLNVNVMEGR